METKVLSTGIPYKNLPLSYIRPVSQRPNLSQVSYCENVPVIDLSCPDRARVLAQLHHACKNYGFFQVINHGVSKEKVENMQKMAKDFFNLPIEEKMKLYSDDPTKTIRLSTSFNVKKEQVHNWRDYLRLHCWPLDQFVPQWPSNPPNFKEIVSQYCKEVRELGIRIEELVSESLGLEKSYITNVLGDQGQHMAINFYPPCPEPEMTYGLPGHTDPNALTILLQDLEVSGLQILKGDKWVAIKPQPDAFSVWHRAVVNTSTARISVASFLCPADDAMISAPSALLTDGARPMYKGFTYPEYYKKFWSRNLDQEHCLELFKNQDS
ncbi:hypothetical protein KSS87_003731 [Heliosperma pusillum]|nr:hypothetical protein KSS87_003731 [Heliosperma pusillum]